MDITAFVDLRISGFTLDLEEITIQLGIAPEKAYKCGDIFIDEKRGNEKVVYQEDCWITGIKKSPEETVEQAFERFISLLKPVSGQLREISLKTNTTVWISIYTESEQKNFHVSSEMLNALAELGVSLDVTMLFLKRFYEGNF